MSGDRFQINRSVVSKHINRDERLLSISSIRAIRSALANTSSVYCKLAVPARLERATYRLEGGCSIQLSYGTEVRIYLCLSTKKIIGSGCCIVLHFVSPTCLPSASQINLQNRSRFYFLSTSTTYKITSRSVQLLRRQLLYPTELRDQTGKGEMNLAILKPIAKAHGIERSALFKTGLIPEAFR
jgi:hypothetical protein